MKKKKVLVGMSGGVDSSVTACLLKEMGYEVIGIHMRFWSDPAVFSDEEIKKFPQNKCCTLDGIQKIRNVAKTLDIPFYILNFEEPFKKDVVDYFIQGYSEGITPNPCIECNRQIKFGLFLQKMKELDADYVATGHYVRKIQKKDRYELWMAKDLTKDQSYFLYTLTQEKLEHILFPLGDFTKIQVREIARKYGFEELNQQKESQNLCFFPERKHGAFLQRYLQKQYFQPGPILTLDGKQIGLHRGLPHYTIGQRKGLGIGGIKGNAEGDPWFIVKIDKAKNALIAGKQSDLFHTRLKAHMLSFIDQPLEGKIAIHAKIRYRFPLQPAMFQLDGKSTDALSHNSSAVLEFLRPQRAITPGQSVVFYEEEKVIGGGIIAS